jgi:hypothetical protein
MMAFPLHGHYRNGRLGGDTAGVAPQVVVEHEVADHEHPATGEVLQQGTGAGAGEGHGKKGGRTEELKSCSRITDD